MNEKLNSRVALTGIVLTTILLAGIPATAYAWTQVPEPGTLGLLSLGLSSLGVYVWRRRSRR